jgi:hypothetical protein
LGSFGQAEIDVLSFVRSSGHAGDDERSSQTLAQQLARQVYCLKIDLGQSLVQEAIPFETAGQAGLRALVQANAEVIELAPLVHKGSLVTLRSTECCSIEDACSIISLP